jgi:DNA-binding CsgD family transcriptional regulator/tetratricopeptide (TPR) repeat protein
VSSEGQLIERDDVLAELHRALAHARDGRGEIALVTGEAGAGKTSVIGEFLRQAAGAPLVLRGACDPLSVPRPLGPLIDAAGDVDPAIARSIASGMPRVEAFAVALSLVDGTHSEGRATVFVIEDAHWADDATLDLITFLGRRVHALPTLLVVSYRDDEVGVQHLLRARLGELTSAIRCRIRLPALSLDAVARLAADTGVDAAALHRTTGGNPFYVTEVLGAAPDALPESVRDAVLARAARLPDDARAVLDAAAVVPGRVERWLLDEVAHGVDVSGGLETCVERGLLRTDTGDAVAFRHELSRLAILAALSSSRRSDFHARALAGLRGSPDGVLDASRLAFHAQQAGDADAVLEHAPAAAAEAAALGAHREATEHLESALIHRARLPAAERGRLQTQLGIERMTLGRFQEAVAAYTDAAVSFAEADDVEGEADALTRCSGPLSAIARTADAQECNERAGRLLAGRPPSPAAALLASSRSQMHMLARRFADSEREGRRAIELAQAVGDLDIEAEASIQSGIALAMNRDDAGLARIRRGMELAAATGNDHLVSLGHTQIGSGYGELRRYDIAVPALRDGVAYSSAREVVTSLHYSDAWLARCELELGHWDDAASIAAALLHNPRCVGISRFVSLVTLGWLRARRGDPDVTPLLDEALDFARSTRQIQRLWPVAACRAEVAWLDDGLADEHDLVEEAATLAAELDYRPAIEELAHWQRMADGVDHGDVATAVTPFGLSAAGRPDLAAAQWAELGCPYEVAMARFATGVVDDLRAAHRGFDALGAAPMAARAAAALREAGVAVPRGPLAATRGNPHSLTDREVEVLGLVATGMTDRAIGAALHISAKTVGHHVSHVLAKLEVRTRAEAAVTAERLGLTANP